MQPRSFQLFRNSSPIRVQGELVARDAEGHKHVTKELGLFPKASASHHTAVSVHSQPVPDNNIFPSRTRWNISALHHGSPISQAGLCNQRVLHISIHAFALESSASICPCAPYKRPSHFPLFYLTILRRYLCLDTTSMLGLHLGAWELTATQCTSTPLLWDLLSAAPPLCCYASD